MSWIYLAYLVATFVISYALTPNPQSAPPPGIGEIKAPTAEVGREIPVLFGTRDIDSPNVVWYGDVMTAPIKSGGNGGKKK